MTKKKHTLKLGIVYHLLLLKKALVVFFFAFSLSFASEFKFHIFDGVFLQAVYFFCFAVRHRYDMFNKLSFKQLVIEMKNLRWKRFQVLWAPINGEK